MPRELVPELHDVLKLTVLKHNFSDFDPFQSHAPDTPTWRGILQHHCDSSFPAYPSDRETFLLHVADGLASNFSRHPQSIQRDVAWTVHRLWNPTETVNDERLSTASEIGAMLKFLATDPDFEEFYTRYRSILRARAEDAHPGKNVTTLETHARLTGRFYRFLQKARTLGIEDREVREAAARGVQAVAGLREQKKREWHLYLFRCRLHILTNPFRARDMNIFALLEEFLAEASAQLGDNTLYASAEELILYSDDVDILNELTSLAAPRGIVLEIRRDRLRVDELNLNFRKAELQRAYPRLEAAVAPPLCEICQMHRATRIWPDDYIASKGAEAGEVAQGRDYLCETCFSIRSRPSKLMKLAKWDEWSQGDLIWIRCGLDFDRLHESLRQLYLVYLRSLDPNIPEKKAEVRFSLLAEFQQDYERYLARLRDSLRELFGQERVETVLPDLLCIQAERGVDVFSVLRCFLKAAERFFPALLGTPGCPLRVSVTYCNARHPFFEVWRQWEEQESELEITAVGHGRVRLEMKHLERFLTLADMPFRQSALHNLADISRISQELAELRFRAAREKGERDTFERLKEFLPLGLTFEGVLTLAKLMGG